MQSGNQNVQLSHNGPSGAVPLPDEYSLSGPYPSGNLTVFLIHGPNRLQNHNLLTLEEAMQQSQVVVNETSNVNMLSIRNLSDKAVFLQSGDVVRGGLQDRALQFDLILPMGKEMPLPTFCVEQGRWRRRQNESAQKFSSSANYVSGKQMKMAAKHSGRQTDVWASVNCHQRKLCQTAGFNSADLASESSFELTMESRSVRDASDQHIVKLGKIIDTARDVIGYAFAINGKMNCADIYASNQLFKKLWSKLLKSTAVEAVAELTGKENFSQPVLSDVLKFLMLAQKHQAKETYITEESVMTVQESDDALLYKTQWCNAAAGNNFIHCNYLAK